SRSPSVIGFSMYRYGDPAISPLSISTTEGRSESAASRMPIVVASLPDTAIISHWKEHFAVLGQRPAVVAHHQLERVAAFPDLGHRIGAGAREQLRLFHEIVVHPFGLVDHLAHRRAVLLQVDDHRIEVVGGGHLRRRLDPRALRLRRRLSE